MSTVIDTMVPRTKERPGKISFRGLGEKLDTKDKDLYRLRRSGMQDTIAGNKNAGNVIRKNTPREHNIPNENAAHDTIACVRQYPLPRESNPSMLKIEDCDKTATHKYSLN